MTLERYHRQSALINMDKLSTTPITIIGAGGIGSATLLTLCQMGARNIHLFDDDVLEEHNISNQIYPQRYVGVPKVEAAKDFMQYMYDFDVNIHNRRYDICNSKIVISGVDSMRSREEIWKIIKEHHAHCMIYIDARMGGMNFEIYNTMPTQETDWYESTIIDDEKALELPCTARAIAFNTMSIAGYIGSQVRNYMSRQKMPKKVGFDLACNQFTCE